MLGTIRKHSNWLWAVIIVVVSVTMVYSFSARMDAGGSGQNRLGSLFGKRITVEDFKAAARETELYYFFNYGNWPDQDAKRNGFDVEKETYLRLVIIQKQTDLNIQVSDDAAGALGDRMLRQLNRGNPVPLEAFVDKVLAPHGLTADDFARFLRHNLGIQQLVSLAGAGGELVTPQEISQLYEREHTEISAQPVFFLASNYLATVTVSPDAFAHFYTNEMSRYHLPERVQVKYVAFAASNFMAEATHELAQVTNLEQHIEATYQQVGTNFYPEAKSPAETKAKIKQVMLEQQAFLFARKQATEFAQALYDLQPVKAGNLEKVAKDKGVVVQVSEPFSREEAPPHLKVAPTFTKVAFALTDEEPFNGPLSADDVAYVIEMDKHLPSENPPLEKVRDRVMADYKFGLALQQAQKAGAEFHDELTNGLAHGKSFADVCKQAGVHPAETLPFSLSTRTIPEVQNHVNLGEFKQAAFSTDPGKASNFTPIEEGGFIVFVRAKLPLNQTRMAAEITDFTEKVRQSRQAEAFNLWFNHEIERGLRDTPLTRQQPTGPAGPPVAGN